MSAWTNDPQRSGSRALQALGSRPDLVELVDELAEISIVGLGRMHAEPGERLVRTMRLDGSGEPIPEGESLRYTAIALLGLQYVEEEDQRRALSGRTAKETRDLLLAEAGSIQGIGDLALAVWSGAEAGAPESVAAAARLVELLHSTERVYTVELAWALTALSTLGDAEEARSAARRLLSARRSDRALFPRHAPPAGGYRDHVGCFADQVYPIQALSRYASTTGDGEALEAAATCANCVCALQGAEGQWWWHYDVRHDQVVEGYPVYSVHQDSMAPMALFELAEAGGPLHGDAIASGLDWLRSPAETEARLVDPGRAAIWRKIDRSGPNKLVRATRALLSRIHPSLRAGFLDSLLAPSRVDWECRPYHLGWILYAWKRG